LPSGELILRSSNQLLRYQVGATVRTGQFTSLANEAFEEVSYDPLSNRLLAIQQNQVSYIALVTGAQQHLLLSEAVKFGFFTRSRK
jgi:hypothetical protein